MSASTYGRFKPAVTFHPDANTWHIIGLCRMQARVAGWSEEDINNWSNNAWSSKSRAALLDHAHEHFDVTEL